MRVIEHRLAVVTGANCGFGYAMALHLARNGFHVLPELHDVTALVLDALASTEHRRQRPVGADAAPSPPSRWRLTR